MVFSDGPQHIARQRHLCAQCEAKLHMLLARLFVVRDRAGLQAHVLGQGGFSDIVQERGASEYAQARTVQAERLAQQQAQHGHIDRVQTGAVAHAFGQQANGGLTVAHQFVDDARHHLLALARGFGGLRMQ